MEFGTAFILGFFGSAHCLGMCGPIALALPVGYKSPAGLLVSRLAYNAGRIVTYVAFGAVVGLAGEGLALAGIQQWVSLIAGILLLLSIVLPARFTRRLLPTALSVTLQNTLHRLWGNIGKQRGALGLFGVGVINGFLPCGFVYLALTAALSVGSLSGAMYFMAAFGLGTVPALLAVSLSGGIIGGAFRRKLSKVFPVVGLALATLLILRGLALNIPYISPDLHKPHHHHMQTNFLHPERQ